MPIYEYLCPQCGRTFEEWTKTTDAAAEEPCPKCGASSPRVMSQTSFVLKGGGWYVSDYGYRKGVREEGEVPVKTAEEGGTASGSTSDPGKPADNSPESTGKSADKPATSVSAVSAPEKPATQSAGKSEAKQGTEKSASAP
ncbi:MAG: zinc ribbon domain-containing protein [Desulfovibrio sp.]|nr:zinc ribbon domain-containing protein [Desulfovibrio sp.]